MEIGPSDGGVSVDQNTSRSPRHVHEGSTESGDDGVITDARSGSLPPTGVTASRYRFMKRLAIPLAGAGLILILAAGAVAAATPPPTAPVATSAPGATPAPVQTPGTLAAILGLTDAQVMALRQQGLSLAQIAERQKVDPQRLIDALAAQWSARIDARLAVGAITADQAKTLKANLAVQAKAMVNQATTGGMRGAAVGAGPNGGMRGMGGGAGVGAGGGRGGMMRGAGAGTGTCPLASTAPSS
jgi:hypothetical protein